MSKIIKKSMDASKSIIGLGGKEPKLPAPEPAKPMPTMDDTEMMKARKKSVASQRKRSGRASTVLSKDETLG